MHEIERLGLTLRNQGVNHPALFRAADSDNLAKLKKQIETAPTPSDEAMNILVAAMGKRGEENAAILDMLLPPTDTAQGRTRSNPYHIPLDFLDARGNSLLMRAVQANKISEKKDDADPAEEPGNSVRALLEAGANISFVNHAGENAFRQAVTRLDLETTGLLLDYGAAIDEPYRVTIPAAEGEKETETTTTPLMMALTTSEGEPMIRLLASRGANLDLPDGNGRSPIVAMAYENDWENMTLLKELGADMKTLDKPDRQGRIVLAETLREEIKEKSESKRRNLDIFQDRAAILISLGASLDTRVPLDQTKEEKTIPDLVLQSDSIKGIAFLHAIRNRDNATLACLDIKEQGFRRHMQQQEAYYRANPGEEKPSDAELKEDYDGELEGELISLYLGHFITREEILNAGVPLDEVQRIEEEFKQFQQKESTQESEKEETGASMKQANPQRFPFAETANVERPLSTARIEKTLPEIRI